MQIQVTGKQIDVGDALRSHTASRLGDIVSKYSQRPVEAMVTFSKDRHEFVADASVHLSTGMTVQAKGRAGDIYGSLDGAAERMEKQLRRYKRRLKDHHQKRSTPMAATEAASYILDAGDTGESATETEEPADLQPLIVAEMTAQVRSMTVGEAVMQMELANAPVLVFRNEKHGGVNVVYRREDGHIGWIDPQVSS
jgi:ribosomal subunit interface protein